MAISDFDFSSPGVQFREVDKSTAPEATPEAGITIIGTAPAGPGMVPTRVTSIEQLERVFGQPNNGQDASSDSDVFRYGNTLLPSYGMYAAKAWLASGESPVTFIRLLGQDAAASDQGSGYVNAGWDNGAANLSTSVPMNNGAFGLFLCPSGAIGQKITGSLAAVIYCTASMVTLRGYPAGQFDSGIQNTITSSAGQLIKSLTGASADTFQLEFWSDDETLVDKKTINFSPTSDGYIRNQLNTNPQKVYSNNFATTEKYFLGETYEESVKRYVTSVSGSGNGYGIVLPLELKSGGATANFMNRLNEAIAPKSGWVISRDPSPTANQADYDVSNMKKLFRVHALHEGEWMHGYHIRICDLKFGNAVNPNCSFSIEVKKGKLTIEKFANLNLDPSSTNYVARRIGTSYQEWDQTYKVFDDTGRYRSRSNFIRIEEAADLKNNAIADSYKIPWGFWGPMRPKGFSLIEGSAGPNAFGDNENAGVQATAVLITDSNTSLTDKTLEIELPDGTTYTATATTDATSKTNIDTDDCASANHFATELQAVLALAEADGLLQGITVSAVENEGGGNPRKITLTAPNPGTDANSFSIGGTLVSANKIYVNPTGDLASNGQGTAAFTGGTDTDDVTNVYVKGNASMPQNANFLNPNRFAHLPIKWSGSFEFPRFKLTEQSTRNGSNYKENMDLGVRQAFSDDSQYNDEAVQKRKDYLDLARRQVYDLHGDVGTNLEASFIFSMDDVVSDPGEPDSAGIARWYWQSGSHATAFTNASKGYISYTAQSGSSKLIRNGPTSFNMPLVGGSNGLDITHVDPFSNWNVLDGKATNTHYAYYSIYKALDMIRDEEKLRTSIISMPGVTETNLIKEIVDIAESRGDTLAIIDYNDGSKESYENSGTRTRGSLSTVIDTSENTLQIDSNKAAAYWPRVELTEGGFSFMAPASVAAIGALAFNDANSAGPWFAPAGFNRGGLSVLGGTLSNLSVTSTDKNLTKKNRDDLYNEHINPIARFPAIGEVVIFGQKTLYKSEPTSALSRVNVRRLMIFLRQRISDIADTVLFEPNVATTFNNFSNRCQTVLENVKSNFGITEYSIQRIEKSDITGTGVEEDLQDRNILYVRIFVKPARAIEFIAIDFVISRSDAQI